MAALPAYKFELPCGGKYAEIENDISLSIFQSPYHWVVLDYWVIEMLRKMECFVNIFNNFIKIILKLTWYATKFNLSFIGHCENNIFPQTAVIHSLSPEQKVSCAKELSHKEDEPADTRADNVNSANSYKGSSQMIDWIIRVQCSRTHHNIWPKLFGTDHHSHRVWTRLNQADLRLIGSGRQHKREMISKHGNDSQWKQEQRKYLEKRHQRKFMRPGSLCAVRLELRVKSLNLGEHVRLTHFQFKFYNSEVSNLIWNDTSA